MVTRFGEDGNEDVPFGEAVFIALRLDFGNSESDKATGDSADCGTRSGTTESGEKRSCGDQRPHTWNRQCADASQQPEGSAKHAACGGSGDGTFRSLGVFLMENSWVDSLSGKRTEMSFVENPDLVRLSTIWLAWPSEMEMAYTDLVLILVVLVWIFYRRVDYLVYMFPRDDPEIA
jgi:hypothetical protein